MIPYKIGYKMTGRQILEHADILEDFSTGIEKAPLDQVYYIYSEDEMPDLKQYIFKGGIRDMFTGLDKAAVEGSEAE